MATRWADLNPREAMFVEAYTSNGFNGKQAAIAAGYSKSGASTQATRLLKLKKIKQAVAQKEKAIAKDFNLEREDILTQLYYALTRSAEDLVDQDGRVLDDIRKMNPRIRACIDGIKQKVTVLVDPETGEVTGEKIETEVKLTSKIAAIDLAMKHKNLFPPKKIEGEINHKHTIDWDALLETKSVAERDLEDVVDVQLARRGIEDKRQFDEIDAEYEVLYDSDGEE